MNYLNKVTNGKEHNVEVAKNKSTSYQIEQIIPRKGQKRKVQDNTESTSKYSNKDKPADDYHFMKSDKALSSKRQIIVDSEDLHNILDDLGSETDDTFEHTASKNKLTKIKVKNIIQHVITNEYVLGMVRNALHNESKDLEEAVFEPKLTRSKAKELSAEQPTLPWLSLMKKGDPETQMLLEKEFLDEGSNDEDYEPKEEDESSDDDDTMPCTSSENYFEEESPLLISIPDRMTLSQETNEADKIALHTRSKLCLSDTSLEEIEASFIAPDSMVDMYDTTCDDDDWLQFLSDLRIPIDTVMIKEQVTEADDAEDDPEYNAQEDDDSPDPLDLSDDPTTRVSREELNALVAENLEFVQKEYMDNKDDDGNKSCRKLSLSSFLRFDDSSILPKFQSEGMTSDEKLQLDEQIRMYVQLLAQSYLLSYGSPDLNFLNISCKLILDELKMFASRELITNKRSVFNAHNLEDALNIVNKTEKHKIVIQDQNEEMQKERRPVPIFARRIIAASEVFIYPELLPVVGYPDPFQTRKCIFATAEDNLIALGLEQFDTINKSTIDFIHSLLVPSKTPRQIKVRIKNCRISKVSLDNPIKYFTVHNKAPQFPRLVRKFDPDSVKIPAKFPLEVLPKWMIYYCRVVSGHPLYVSPPVHLSQSSPLEPSKSSSLATVSRPMFRKKLKDIKRPLLLPYGGIISPLRQIKPNWKENSQSNELITVLPITLPCSKRRTSGHCLNKTIFKPCAIKPKPVLTTENHCTDLPEKHISVPNTGPSIIQPTQTVPFILSMTATQPTTVSVVQPMLISTNPIVSSSLSSPMVNNQTLSNEYFSSIQISNPSEQIETNSELNSNVPNEVVTLKEEQLFEEELIQKPSNIQIHTTLSSPVGKNQTLSNEYFSSIQISNPSEQIETNPELNSNILNEIMTLKEEPIEKPTNIEIHFTSDVIKIEEMSEDESDASLSAAVATTIPKKLLVSEKKNKLCKDLDSCLTLLRPTVIGKDQKKSEETPTNKIISMPVDDSSLPLDDHLIFEPAISAISCSQPTQESNVHLNDTDNIHSKSETSVLKSMMCCSVKRKEFEESTIQNSIIETQKKNKETLESININQSTMIANQKKMIDCLEVIIKNQEIQINNQASLLQLLDKKL